jgi:putative aldouronate transport system permease protein
MALQAGTGSDSRINQNKRRKLKREDVELFIIGLPCFVWYLIFCYLPMFGLVIAFKSYKISPGHSFVYSLIKSDWVGFKNFQFFIKSNAFGMLLRNTVLYNIVFIVLGIVIPVTLAIMINLIYNKRIGKIYQTVMFFPHFVSWVVASYFVYAFLSPQNGLMNAILRDLGKEPVMWYSTPKYWPFILTFMHLWKSVGYGMVVYLACIAGIDQTLYEAAVIDGASIWQQTRYITIPSMVPYITMMFILNTGRIFYSDFGLFYQVTQRVPNSLYTTVSTFDTYMYSALQSSSPIGQTAAASLFQATACCVTILIANFITKKINSDYSII